MIVSFKTQGTSDLFHGRNTKAARKTCPRDLWAIARRKLDQLNTVEGLVHLRIPPGNQLEALRGDRSGQHSVRINRQYRVCFVWTDAGPDGVEVLDYH